MNRLSLFGVSTTIIPMSEPPNDPQPIPAVPLGYYVPSEFRRRPVMLSIIAWVAIVWGAFSSLGLLSALMFFAFEYLAPTFLPNFSGQSGLHGLGKFFDYMMVLSLISGFAGIACLTGGILTLNLRPLGRKFLIGYGVFYILYAILGTIAQFMYLVPAANNVMIQQTRVTTTSAPSPVVTNRVVAVNANANALTTIPTIISVGVQVAVAGAILFYLMRSQIRSLFVLPSAPGQESPGGPVA